MKPFLEEYFQHTRSERMGAVVLMLICALSTLFPLLLPTLFPKSTTDFSTFQSEIAAFKTTQQSSTPEAVIKNEPLFVFNPNTASKDELIKLGLSERTATTLINFRDKIGGFKHMDDVKKVYGLKAEDFRRLQPFMELETKPSKAVASTNKEEATPIKTLFFFNPNVATVADFQQLGLSPKVATTIVNYRAKGGTFRQKEDLKKIYGLSEEAYARLEAFIELPEQEEEKPKEPLVADEVKNEIPVAYENLQKVKIDINLASEKEWQKLRGIGPKLSRRIVRFRDALGGFATIEQVAETYNLPDSTFQSIKDQLIDSPIQQFIKINEADAAALKAHPYLKWNEANAIVNYRMQHGKYQSIEDLLKVKILSSELIEKMKPYIQF